MSEVRFDPKARWIWCADARRPYNNFVCFRCSFTVKGSPKRAALLVTADARCEFYVNGTWVGHGPVRSWPSPWPVDEYDLRGLLNAGRNVLAFLVQDLGMSTMQYIHCAPGLLAQLDLQDRGGRRRIGTDRSWRCRLHPGYGWPVPRIGIEQGWEEQFDARLAPGWRDWQFAEFDDGDWAAATVMRRPGDPPHERFERRDIPMLTRQPVEPVRLASAEVVRPAPYTWSVSVRGALAPHERGVKFEQPGMLLATHIWSDSAQAVQLHEPNYRRPRLWKLNGAELKFDDCSLQLTESGVAHARLRKGWNTLLFRLVDTWFAGWISLNIWARGPLRFAARPGGARNETRPWLAIGPFAAADNQQAPARVPLGSSALGVHPEATTERLESIWERGALDEADMQAPFTRRLGRDMVARADVFTTCASERVEKRRSVRVERRTALLSDNADWTSILPADGGADVRLLFDFGREVVGYHEFEVDASAGTILDFHNFEFIQRDGRINLADGMNNSFRYVCRAGVQRYRTFVRRGFRYSWLTLRNLRRPVRIRFVRVLMSTYPVAGQGDFACSDALMERMWQVGAHTVRCCSEDTYTDCPCYEQTHWVGDARNEALVDLVSSGDPRLSRHCWIQAARSLSRSPLVECHVPSGWQMILPAWSFLWMRWAREHYMFTGDRPLARVMLRYLERNFRGIERHINEHGLFEICAWNMFDWAPMDTPFEGVVTHQNCLAVLALRDAADLARRLAQRGRARRWEALADRLSCAINRHLWSERRRAYVDCIHADGTPSKVLSQQTHTAAYVSGVATSERGERCLAVIEKPPRGFVKAGSPFFMFFALEAMIKAGRRRKMLEMMRDYWGAQIEAGATTFWETCFPGSVRKTRSNCHGWSAAPTYFLTQHVLGVQPLEPGYACALIAPEPAGLNWAQGRVPTPRGVIECRWSREGKHFALDVSLPPKTAARIELPFSGRVRIEEGEAARLKSPRGGMRLDCSGPRIKLSVTR